MFCVSEYFRICSASIYALTWATVIDIDIGSILVMTIAARLELTSVWCPSWVDAPRAHSALHITQNGMNRARPDGCRYR